MCVAIAQECINSIMKITHKDGQVTQPVQLASVVAKMIAESPVKLHAPTVACFVRRPYRNNIMPSALFVSVS